MNNANFKSPAYPLPIAINDKGEIFDITDYDLKAVGFSKQEKGALIIAAALIGRYNLKSPEDQQIIAQLSNELAKAVLEEANK
jgi:hypothetical protein